MTRASFRTALRRSWPLAVLALVGSLLAYRRFFAPVRVRAAHAVLGAVTREVRGVGRLESPSEVALGFDVPGRIDRFLVDQGSRVHVGDVLARLDVEDVSQQLSIARASRGVSTTAIESARAEAARAQATRDAAASDHVRVLALLAGGAATPQERDASVARLAIAEADLRARRSALEQASRSASVAGASVALQQVRVEHGVLRSPLDGVVLIRHREQGDVVAPGMPVLTVAAVDRLWARVWVDETALGALRVGQPARIELRSEPGRMFSGEVDRIAPEADRETHEVLVDVSLREMPERYAIGQRADAWVTLEHRGSVVRVPRSFCDVDRGSCVVARDGRALALSVRFGLRGDDDLEVQSGLRDGDAVVSALAQEREISTGRRVLIVETR